MTLSLEQALARVGDLLRTKQMGDAKAMCLKILESVPNQPDALYLLGVALYMSGDMNAAIECINRSLEVAPDNPNAINDRGNMYRTIGKLDAAEADYRRALLLRPDDMNALANLGTIARARGDWDDAIATFRAVFARQPDHAGAWVNLANTLGGTDRRAEALEACQQAARFVPESVEMLLSAGMLLGIEGRAAEAAEMYRRCLAMAPGHARARHLLAACTGQEVPSRASDDYVRTEFDQFAINFDARLAKLEYRGPELVTTVAREIATTLPPGPTVLDAGCGTGLCGPLLRPFAGRLVGVDLSSRMLALAGERKCYDELTVGELTAFMNEHAREYGLIVSADTFVYFGDLTGVIAAASSALGPGGALIFTVEQAEAAAAPLGFELQGNGRYRHVREYIARVVLQARMDEPVIVPVETRKEAQAWVPGWLVRASVPQASGPENTG